MLEIFLYIKDREYNDSLLIALQTMWLTLNLIVSEILLQVQLNNPWSSW